MEMIPMHARFKRIESFVSSACAGYAVVMTFQFYCYLVAIFACARSVKHALTHALFAALSRMPVFKSTCHDPMIQEGEIKMGFSDMMRIPQRCTCTCKGCSSSYSFLHFTSTYIIALDMHMKGRCVDEEEEQRLVDTRLMPIG
jgi:hypothetical protein